MITFEDPFARVLGFVVEEYDVDARVCFVDRRALPRLSWRLRRAKGATLFPDDGSVPVVMVDARLRRGVQGTLDILAHELAHVVAGPEAEHGPAWARVYGEIYEACCAQPTAARVFRRKVKYTPPRYDEVFAQGVEWLDGMVACRPVFNETEVEAVRIERGDLRYDEAGLAELADWTSITKDWSA